MVVRYAGEVSGRDLGHGDGFGGITMRHREAIVCPKKAPSFGFF